MPNQSFLIFSLNSELFAMDASVVREIIWLPEIAPIEEEPPYIVGVINLRGKIIPVMDLNLRFGHKPKRYYVTDRVIAIEISPSLLGGKGEGEQQLLGIIVNDVHDVKEIPQKDIEPLPLVEKEAKPSTHFIKGEAKAGEEIIMVINHLSLVADDKMSGYLTANGASRYFSPDASVEERAVFHKRAMDLMKSPIKEAEGLVPISVVVLNDEFYGIDLKDIREFADIDNPATVPCCPSHIFGDMSLRGNILTLIDIKGLLNIPAGAPKKAVVAGIGDFQVGITVDGVMDILYLKPSDITPVPSAIEEADKRYIKGEATYNGRVITIIDLQKILSREDLVVEEEV